MQSSFAHEIALKNSTNFQKQTQFPKQSFFLGFSDDRFSSGLHFCSGWLRPVEVGHDFGPHFLLPSPNLPREPFSCSILRKRITDSEPRNSGVPSKISPFPERRQKFFNFHPPRKKKLNNPRKICSHENNFNFHTTGSRIPTFLRAAGNAEHSRRKKRNERRRRRNAFARNFCARQFAATNST